MELGARNLPGFVEWIDKDGPVAAVGEDLAEHFPGKVVDFGSGYEEIKPRVWDFPQPLALKLHLRGMDSIEEVDVRHIRHEHC